MQPKLPQYNTTFEMEKTNPSGIGEAAQYRKDVVQKAVINGFAGLAPMLPKPETYVNPAPATNQPENYPQQVATQAPQESNFLKEEEARNNLDAIYQEIKSEQGGYNLAA